MHMNFSEIIRSGFTGHGRDLIVFPEGLRPDGVAFPRAHKAHGSIDAVRAVYAPGLHGILAAYTAKGPVLGGVLGAGDHRFPVQVAEGRRAHGKRADRTAP